MRRAEMKQIAKERLSANKGPFMITCLIFMACLMACNGIITVISGFQESRLVLLLELLTSFVGTYSVAAITHMAIQALRGREVSLQTGFEMLNRVLDIIIASVIMYVKIFLWSLLFLIPGIIAIFRYSLTFYIMADRPELTATECIEESKRLTKGHKFEIFMIGLSFILWGILVVLTFGLAACYVTPYYTITMAVFYQNLKKETGESINHKEKNFKRFDHRDNQNDSDRYDDYGQNDYDQYNDGYNNGYDENNYDRYNNGYDQDGSDRYNDGYDRDDRYRY